MTNWSWDIESKAMNPENWLKSSRWTGWAWEIRGPDFRKTTHYYRGNYKLGLNLAKQKTDRCPHIARWDLETLKLCPKISPKHWFNSGMTYVLAFLSPGGVLPPACPPTNASAENTNHEKKIKKKKQHHHCWVGSFIQGLGLLPILGSLWAPEQCGCPIMAHVNVQGAPLLHLHSRLIIDLRDLSFYKQKKNNN